MLVMIIARFSLRVKGFWPPNFPKTVLLLLIISRCFGAFAQVQSPLFGRVGSVTGAADDVGNAIAVDSVGNSFVTGYFMSANAMFGGTVLTNAGGAEVFLAKYDFAGGLLWARR